MEKLVKIIIGEQKKKNGALGTSQIIPIELQQNVLTLFIDQILKEQEMMSFLSLREILVY